ncbi:M48 family metalloprotease [Spirosoma endophyticum]|uniref:Peptidase family M48 n=1 Tax=Spirosoma endophyticum TaxID=662367 RepID=A0A1I2GHC7_9BACT|nr:hypothetical protein [Spirosoma endophyticum]SFF16257.1 hypothetical protein SAMN05216167_1329 [Spirosoma endophyticum]
MRLLVQVVLLSILLAHQTKGQSGKPQRPTGVDESYKIPCDCDALTSVERKYIPSEKEAGVIVANFLKIVRQHSSLKYSNTIIVKAAGCGAPEARNCPTTLPNNRTIDIPLILYNNVFLEGINKKMDSITRIDKHILAHEIGHHVFGHLKNTENEAVFSELQGTDAVNSERIARRFKVSNRHAEEIQADFFGLWLLSLTEKSLDFEAFIAEFNLDYIRKYIEVDARFSASHPLFKDRIKAMRRFWDQLQIRQLQRKGISQGYFSNSASTAYIELHPDRTFWDLGLVAGLTVVAKPMFTAGGQPVDAFLYSVPDAYNLYTGLNVSRYRWNNPWRYEGEIAYSKQTFGTTIGQGNDKRLVETLELRYLTVFPKISWNSVGVKNTNFASNRFGFFVSAGPIMRMPLGLDYQNRAVTVAPTSMPTLRLSINPRISLGVELLQKTFLPRGYKVALTYEWSSIKLTTDPRPETGSHNFDLTLQYNFARW